jgi:uncharacterized protein
MNRSIADPPEVSLAGPPDIDALAEKEQRLDSILRAAGSVVLGYSGGVDSTLLLRKSLDVLGAENVLAITAASATYADEEIDEAVRLADWLGAPHERLRSTELEDEGFLLNPPERCYYCKADLYGDLVAIAESRGFGAVIDGSHAEDALDFRPGLKALDEKGVLSPLKDAGFTKADIRALSRRLGLPTADKPANACLASRFPYGEAITAEKLNRVGQAERVLRDAGFPVVRVRHHGDVARIEVPIEDRARLVAATDAIVPRIKALGFVWVACDLEGYRSGSMNEAL